MTNANNVRASKFRGNICNHLEDARLRYEGTTITNYGAEVATLLPLTRKNFEQILRFLGIMEDHILSVLTDTFPEDGKIEANALGETIGCILRDSLKIETIHSAELRINLSETINTIQNKLVQPRIKRLFLVLHYNKVSGVLAPVENYSE